MTTKHDRRTVKTTAGFSLIELLMVMCITAVVAAFAVPFTSNTLAYFRLSGDAHAIFNGVEVAKMRAASTFSQARLYIDYPSRSHRSETLRKNPAAWIAEGGNTFLAYKSALSAGGVTNPPPNTQAAVAQAPNCRDAAGAVIANTSCITFNSRGIPVDATGAPTGAYAMYLTDGTAVYAITVSAAGQVRLWRAAPAAVANWIQQ